MHLRSLLGAWRRSNEFESIVAALNEPPPGRLLVSGLEGSQRNYLNAALYDHWSGPVLIVAHDSLRAEKVYEDLLTFLPEEEVKLLPGRDFIIGEGMLGQSRESWAQRMEAMEQMAEGRKMVFVAPLNAIVYRMMPPDAWLNQVIFLRLNLVVDREELIKKLVNLGYERVPLIEEKAQFSVRGDIIDLFPPGQKNPVRLELFDDTLTSIRAFDCVTQRSLEIMETFRIYPAAEVILTEADRRKGMARIEDELQRVTGRLNRQKGTAERLKEKVGRHLARMNQPVLEEAFYGYFPYFYARGDSLLDYLHNRYLVIIDDPARTAEAAQVLLNRGNDFQSDLLVQGDALSSETSLTWSFDELMARLKVPCLFLSLFKTTGIKVPREGSFSFSAKDIPNYYGQWDLLHGEFREWEKEGYNVYLLSPSSQQAEVLFLHLRDQEFSVLNAGAEEKLRSDRSAPPQVTIGNLNNGFIIPSLQIVFVTEQNLFPKRKKRKRLGGREEGLYLRHYRELNIGDYVVHDQHGIGKYLGVQTLEIEGIKKDYLDIRYAGKDKLFIPIEQIDLIQKYIGVEGKAPKLQRLGGNDWNRIKGRVKASVQKLAGELISIYAARSSLQGRSYSIPHPWQSEFDSYFPYEETADQLQSIEEVRNDLAKDRPMDRLLCGDVGYGKTEVAMRAAFNVVMEGKQVAVLTPTTILAQQHYRNFCTRFSSFPVRVSLLSRFLSAARQKEQIKDLSGGGTDIIIGTHRLLSNDVQFKDLGLIIIDEEHRFGVRHKEKFKKIRLDVDVLTLTATPIPRTLHMSLVGARDLSIIETPPENRYPVQTYVLEYSDQVVREAVRRELGRGGQIYYVFNRVQHIEKWAHKLKELVPEAGIAVAHGQMDESKLERVMNDFLAGDYDILLSTTIIEAGLDIPNVNTLIIYDADRFGLAQLYQLRGRVGRSNRPAYAYLTFQRDKVLTEAAEKRLQAIKEFAELGSGFKVAMRDLEIRGAGNILGPEQHGFMAAVGFELYCQMLEEAVRTYKGEEVVPAVSPRLDLKISAYLPTGYIPDQEQKIELYQRIYALDSQEGIDEIRKELLDRFGSLPLEVENLLLVSRLRVLASSLCIASIHHENGQINVKFDQEQKFDTLKLWRLVKQYSGRMKLTSGKEVMLKIRPYGEKDETSRLRELEDLLVLVREVVI